LFLALREMRRSLVRFGLLVVAIGLLVFLILFQQALRDGLITSFVGGVRNQSAPVLVYSVDAQRILQGSVIAPPLERQIRDAKGVRDAAQVSQSTFTVEVNGGDESDAAILGTDDRALFHPTGMTGGRQPSAPAEAVGSDADFSVGDRVEVVPAAGGEPVTLTVVGVARDIQLSVTPTLFTDLTTFNDAASATNPDATERLPNALAVVPAAGTTPSEVVADINTAAPDAEALTRADAADKSPGVAQVRQSFQIIFLLYGLVVPLVTGLFFLILTLQKAGSLTLLRAIGARGGVLAGSLLIQVILVVGLGLAVGIALYYPVSQARVGGLSLRFDPTVVVVWSVLLTVLALVSALASLRRVLRIDPIEATTGGGVR
jgi:putative ABC transport system permease protein